MYDFVHLNAFPSMPPLPQTITEEHGFSATPPSRGSLHVGEEEGEAGYDSDGVQGPFFDAVQEEGRLEGDDEKEAGAGDADLPVTEVAVENDDAGRILERIDKMKNDELRKELQRRSCSVKGRKSELVARLREAVEKKLPLVAEMSAEVQANLAGDGFALGAKWEIQEPDDGEVEDEANRVIDSISFREPTVGVADVLQGVKFAKKKNYRMVLDRPPFISSCRQPKRENGKLVYDK